MSRSKWKGPVFDEKLSPLILSQENLVNWNKKIKKRNYNLPFVQLEERLYIHNGNLFKRVVLTKERTGFKLGFFSDTRKFRPKFGKSIIKKGNKK
jgi:ribosomal protein S19